MSGARLEIKEARIVGKPCVVEIILCKAEAEALPRAARPRLGKSTA